MKQLLKKIVSFSLAWVVLFSTLSFTVGMHYCGDTLVDIAVYNHAEGCGMEQESKAASNDCSITKTDCCDSTQILLEGQNQLKNSNNTSFTVKQQFFVVAFITSYVATLQDLSEFIIPFKEYSAPFLVTDVQILFDTFLI